MLRILGFFVGFAFLAAIAAGAGAVFVFWHYGRNLPDHRQLATYELPTSTRVHAADGRLLAEFAIEHRSFVTISVIPKRVVQAFLAAEDDSFFEHPGVDALSVARAAVTNLVNLGEGRRPVGASTITQQVAKNFLLGSEISIERKIKEAILAFRMEKALSKERILELYLNEIYLGLSSYGVAAASLNYFNKPLDSLTLGEAAYLAALPKGPNNYHPIRRPEAAKARRDWVLNRMVEERFVPPNEAIAASREQLRVFRRDDEEIVHAPHFSEEVRRQLYRQYGERGLYEGGLSVRTTLAPHLQVIAEKALRSGLIAYDRRHGFRGPVSRIDASRDWASALAAVPMPKGGTPWQIAVVVEVGDRGAGIGFANGRRAIIPNDELAWARSWLPGEKLGPKVRHARDVLAVGDVVLVEAVDQPESGLFALRQVPEVQGALVALDPHTGRVLAMVGGYSFEQSQFNRAVQAFRQPGSSFKPFVYIAALENGFTPSSRILDAPFVIDQGPGLPKWKPANYTNRFYGPSTLRLGIEKSRNLMTVRLAQFLGMEAVGDYASRFGVSPNLPPQLSMSLGAGETTLLQLTAGYAMFVNGGKRIEPSLIDRIQDRRGATVFRHDQRQCQGCRDRASAGAEPALPDPRQQVVSPEAAYQMVSMLQGVVERGTGARLRELGRPLAGKTGTTNDSNDAWFVGFSPDLAVGVFVGFDQPRSLGPNEQGASVALPIFRDFMAGALADKPKTPFRIPKGVRLVRVDAESGLKARPGDQHVILEAFRPGTEPTSETPVLDGSDSLRMGTETGAGTGGLY
jgi:penicillin-binding protein 1A